MAEGVCPKTQDTRGMSTLVSCNSWRSVSFAPRDFPAFLPLRRVFPRSEIFVCLHSIFHIVDVPPTIQQFRITNSTYFQLVLDRLFSVYSILSRKSPVYKSLIQQFLLGRTERWKKKEKVRKMQDRDGSRKRRLIWSEECREIREIFKQFHGPVNLTRCFPSSFFFFFWMDQVEKYRNRGRTSQPWIRETFWRVNVLRSPMIVDGKVFVSTSDSWNSVMPTPGVNNPSLIVTPPPPDNSH